MKKLLNFPSELVLLMIELYAVMKVLNSGKLHDASKVFASIVNKYYPYSLRVVTSVLFYILLIYSLLCKY